VTAGAKTILHVSDLHFGRTSTDVADALVCTARELRPDLVIVSGDITQRARRDQWDAARDFVGALGAPQTLVVPGNHDIPLWNLWSRVRQPYAGFVRAFGPALEPVVDDAALLVIGVNTTRVMRHKRGEVSRAQVQRVAQALRGATITQLRIVVTHQPLAAPFDDVHGGLLVGRREALAAWVDAGADLLLAGHLHRAALVDVGQGRQRRAWVLLGGTAVSKRMRAGAGHGFNLVRWQPVLRTVEVEHWAYDARAGCWSAAASHRLEVQRPGGVPPHGLDRATT
jgi:3',5'-cyclic AMP phosphodiesterase CpdA